MSLKIKWRNFAKKQQKSWNKYIENANEKLSNMEDWSRSMNIYILDFPDQERKKEKNINYGNKFPRIKKF